MALQRKLCLSVTGSNKPKKYWPSVGLISVCCTLQQRLVVLEQYCFVKMYIVQLQLQL